ncbi:MULTISPECIES: hypothetical protein [unclassified Bradyrhizobium]|uniref:hypothetical protein n=1 Tax=unclassified Bradyrhizobium TaxID=2631580 RepID=UPI002915F99A|nr:MULTISPECIES: hypothetical protein [unclassified Bradyrhizobium]
MAATSNVSGLFYVIMDVKDSTGSSVSSIPGGTPPIKHVISVENISALSQNVKVKASLPNSTRSIEFVDGSGTYDQWSDSRVSVASGVTVTLDFELRRNGGPKNSAEPIQCDDVEDSIGSLASSSATCGVPFSMTIAAT